MKKIKISPLIIMLILIFSLASPAALALEDPNIGAQAAVLVDLDSGRVIYNRNMDEQRAPASLTKIMTALLTLEAIEDGRASMADMVTAQNDCRTGMDETSSTSGIVPGLTLSLEELLYCTLLQSANEACNVIAVHLSGSIEAFVAAMNERAKELGCVNTNFVNPNGLPADGHYSSAYDLYLITKEALKHPVFLEICNTKSHQSPLPEINGGKPMENSNALINSGSIYGSGYLYEYASGVKTGYTRAAGNCLISTAAKDGVNVLAVVMGCDGNQNTGIDGYLNFEDSINIYDWVFDNFQYRDIISAADPVGKAEVKNAKGNNQAILRPAEDLRLLLPFDLDSESIVTTPFPYDETVEAPVKAGQVLGEIKVTIDGEDYGSVELVNSTDIELAGGKVFMLKLKEFFSKTWVITLIVIILVILSLYLFLLASYKKARREHMRRRRQLELRRAEQEREKWEQEQASIPISRSEFYESITDYDEPEDSEQLENDPEDADSYLPDGYYQDDDEDEEYGSFRDEGSEDSYDPLSSIDWDDILK